jgi:hypothetical protein
MPPTRTKFVKLLRVNGGALPVTGGVVVQNYCVDQAAGLPR